MPALTKMDQVINALVINLNVQWFWKLHCKKKKKTVNNNIYSIIDIINLMEFFLFISDFLYFWNTVRLDLYV